MKKVVCLSVLTISLIFSSSNFSSAAEITTKGENLMDQIQTLSERKLSSEKKEHEYLKIIKDAPKEEQEEYFEEVIQIVEDGLKNIDVNIKEGEQVNVDLGSNISLELDSDDTSESSLPKTPVLMSANGYDLSNGNIMAKNYGNRRFSCTVSVKSLGVTIGKLVLVNHYSVGTYGLKFREATTVGTSGVEPLIIISKSSAKVDDSKAEKVGYDMNARGNYSWKIGIKGIYKSFTSEIYSTIKLRSWDKKKKSVIVEQNYKFTE